MNRNDIEDAIKPYGFTIEQARNGHPFIMYGKIAVGFLSYNLGVFETFRVVSVNGFAPQVLLTPENMIPTIRIGATYQREQASERYFECLEMMKRLDRDPAKSDPEIVERKPDPNNEDLVELTLTVRLPRATADAIRRGEPYRLERERAVPEVVKVDPEKGDSIIRREPGQNQDPDIQDKPKRPTVIPRPWSEFADAGMFWFVNRLLHVFGWVICRETEPDGTISGVYPARTRWRGFPEKDETEGFRKVTADIQAHIDDLVEDCQD